MKFLKIVFFLLSAVVFFSCKNTPEKAVVDEAELLYKPAYATSFYITKSGDEKRLHVFNPWQGAKDMELIYHLYPRGTPHSDTIAPMQAIPVPVQRVVCLSTTHIALIDCVQQASTIVGVSGAGYISNATVCEGMKRGAVRDVGYETLLSYETIVALRPDVVFAYGVNGEMAAVTNKLNEMGVRVVYLADYLEESLLGKAEYMVAMAAFYNQEELVSQHFSEIAEVYEIWKEKTNAIGQRPRVILNAPWRDTWYMPGAENYMSKAIRDAGAEVIGTGSGRNTSPLSLEAAYTYALQADYWLNPNYIRTLDELKSADARFANTPAFVNKKVYNNTKRATPGGGSDFWESGVVNPHIVLQDLIRILHPELAPEHELFYYEKLR